MRPLAAFLICLSLVVGVAACKPAGGGGSAGGASSQADMSLGVPTAKVQMYEYASLGCPICARWNNDSFAAFKAKYIDTGKVHYTLREMLTGDAPVSAAGFLLARCAGPDKYFSVVDAVFHQEAPLLESGQGGQEKAKLVEVAQSAGITEDAFEKCASDDAALAAMQSRVDAEAKLYNVNSTPTFVINGKSYTGYQDAPTMDKAIADAEAAAQ